MNDRHLYRFGEFELIADENVLYRNGRGVSLTPKMYDMLTVLVRNHGQILDKETLLKEVWPDSFVEEGNIAFNIRQLRKALEDDAQSPEFIETIPRRGYRFIAPVEEVDPSVDTFENGGRPESDLQPAALATVRGSKHNLYPILALTALPILAAVVLGTWYFVSTRNKSPFTILNEAFSSEKLSTTGLVFAAAISPDGNSVVYSTKQGAKSSLWLRQLPSANNVEIVPASDGRYFKIVFSPDGDTIYFSRGMDGAEGRIDIFKMPLRGGIPEKIVDSTQGWLSVSPDASNLSYVRCPYTDEEFCSLWVANSRDGRNERRLASRPRPYRIGENEISPDGKRVAFATGQSRNQASEFRLMEVGIDGTEERELTADRFFNIRGLTWLPDQSGLLLTASRIPNKYFRIWRVTTPNGSAEALTKDSETYSVLSLDRNGTNLISTQVKQDFNVYSLDISDPAKKRLLAVATNTAFAPDGTVVFSSLMSGNDEIWRMKADGTEQRQLTNDPADDRQPIPSRDGRTIFFTSNRTGEAHVWRMDMDGNGQKRVTQNAGGYPWYVSPDDKVLYYRHAVDGTLWSVSLENGEEKPFVDKHFRFSFSPDGTLAAFFDDTEAEPVIKIISFSDRQVVKKFQLNGNRASSNQVAWMPNGKGLLYILSEGNRERVNKLYWQDLNGGPPRELADLGRDEIGEVSSLSVSPDGKTAAIVQGGWKYDAVLIKGLK